VVEGIWALRETGLDWVGLSQVRSVVEDVTEYHFSCQLRSFIASCIASVLERCMQYVTIAMDLRTKVCSWSLYSHFRIHSTYRIIKPRETKIVLEFEIGRHCHFRR
jgi:hypothetical protein